MWYVVVIGWLALRILEVGSEWVYIQNTFYTSDLDSPCFFCGWLVACEFFTTLAVGLRVLAEGILSSH